MGRKKKSVWPTNDDIIATQKTNDSVYPDRALPTTTQLALATMVGNGIGPLGRAWLRWKSLRLPWRKRFLVGMHSTPDTPSARDSRHRPSPANPSLRLPGFDLQGNTYWEFRLGTRGTGEASPNGLGEVERWRRIVQYPRATHLSAVKVGPLWHQWLRYTRRDPPSLDEQRGDVVRQARLKQLAAEADARWAAKPRVMEDPLPGGHEPALPEAQQPTTTTAQAAALSQEPTTLRAESKRRRKSTPRDDEVVEVEEEQEADPKDPWKQARRGPSEDWQPQAWSPNTKK